MRHVYFRGIFACVWVGAGIVSGFALYYLMGAAFLYSAYDLWKKEKNGKGDD